TRELPSGEGWLYEPKVGRLSGAGFLRRQRADGSEPRLAAPCSVLPELVAGLRRNLAPGMVVDGEIVITGPKGLDFDALLLRIHPAASRIKMLARETPS